MDVVQRSSAGDWDYGEALEHVSLNELRK
jgi:hypothetical protein